MCTEFITNCDTAFPHSFIQTHTQRPILIKREREREEREREKKDKKTEEEDNIYYNYSK